MTPTFRRTPAERLVAPLERFLHTQASGGILLLLCTIIALVWANSSFGGSYVELWKKTEVGFTLGGFEISHPLYWWVNDGLMAIFFFVVGLEIKRELAVGELSEPRKVVLPVVAAAGGAVVPVLLFLGLQHGEPGAKA